MLPEPEIAKGSRILSTADVSVSPRSVITEACVTFTLTYAPLRKNNVGTISSDATQIALAARLNIFMTLAMEAYYD